MSTIISRKAKRNRRKGKDTMEKPGTRLPISYLIISIVLSVILFGVCVVIHFSSRILDYSRTIATKNLLAFDVPIPKIASRSQLDAVDPEREAGLIKVTTTTTTTSTAATADLEREEIERATTATTIVATTIRAGDIFVPGSLNMTRFEAHQRCYVDQVLYKNHHQQPANRYVSEQHKLIYFQITKGGSTLIRKKLDDFFEDILQHPCIKGGIKRRARFNNDTFHKFTFSREPTSRFVSAFSEAMRRWLSKPKIIGSLVPPTKELKDFVRIYNQTYLKEDDDGYHVVEAFETFVTNHYDGYTIPNNHLTLQMAQIFRPKNCLRLDVIHDLENLDNVFHELLMGHGLAAKTVENQKKHPARPSKFHLNLSMVSVKVKQKVCQLSALDYCCLNYRLPPECEGVVSCRWRETKTSPWARNLLPSNNSWATVYTNTNTNTSISTSVSTSTSINDLMLRIEPVSPYPLLPTQQQQRKKDSEKA